MIAKYIDLLIIIIFLLLAISMFFTSKYINNKGLKITLISFIILITSFLVILSIDLNRAKSFKAPFFSIESNNQSGVNANSLKYQGIVYEVILEEENDLVTKIEMKMFGKLIFAGIRRSVNEFYLVDESHTCDTALEFIYEDDNNAYYFSCIKSKEVFLVFNEGNRISVHDAILDYEEDWGKKLITYYPEYFIKQEKTED